MHGEPQAEEWESRGGEGRREKGRERWGHRGEGGVKGVNQE